MSRAVPELPALATDGCIRLRSGGHVAEARVRTARRLDDRRAADAGRRWRPRRPRHGGRQAPRHRGGPAAGHPAPLRRVQPPAQARHRARRPAGGAGADGGVLPGLLRRGRAAVELPDPLVALLPDLPAARRHRHGVRVPGRRHRGGVPGTAGRFAPGGHGSGGPHPQGAGPGAGGEPLLGVHRPGVQRRAPPRAGYRGGPGARARLGHPQRAVAADDRGRVLTAAGRQPGAAGAHRRLSAGPAGGARGGPLPGAGNL